MKRVAMMLVAVVSVGLLSASTLITQDEALVSGALVELKFEPVKNTTGLIGAPPKFAVSKKTLEHLQKLMDAGQSIEVQPNGSLKVVKPAK